MTRRDRPRRPTAEDRALWDSVSKTVTPLNPRVVAATPDAATPAPAPANPPPPPAEKPLLRARSRPPDPPRLAPFDRRLKARIGRGTVTIDARIDLHGLTQAHAHQRLRAFLSESQASGAKLVLVITGKGQAGAAQPIGEGRGILKRLVPIWLASAELRPFVVGYEAAGRSHGGEGALYVRVRARKPGA